MDEQSLLAGLTQGPPPERRRFVQPPADQADPLSPVNRWGSAPVYDERRGWMGAGEDIAPNFDHGLETRYIWPRAPQAGRVYGDDAEPWEYHDTLNSEPVDPNSDKAGRLRQLNPYAPEIYDSIENYLRRRYQLPEDLVLGLTAQQI